MSHQRWGAFSVMDHKAPGGLAPEVLLYDKLVFPVPVTDQQWARWEREGWEPGRQEELMGKLGDLAHQTRWDAQDQLKWAEQYESLKQEVASIVEEARQELSYEVTRMVLAQKKYPIPRGVEGIDVVAANQSERDFRKKFEVNETAGEVSDLGLKLGQRLAVSFSDRDPENALESAIQLAREMEFLQKRTTVYQLQNKILSSPAPALEDVQDLEEATKELIGYISLMVKPVKFAYAFALVGIQPGSAAGLPSRTFTSGSTTLSTVQFRSRFPGLTHPIGSSAPTAVYHD
ncbi:MAG: hypothetical protein WBQ94_13440 [Terracidiphilus sp.]